MGRPKGSKNKSAEVVSEQNEVLTTTPPTETEVTNTETGNELDISFETPADEKITEIVSSFSSENTSESESAPVAEEPKLRTRGRKKKSDEPVKTFIKVPAKLFLKVNNKLLLTAIQFGDRYSKNPIPVEYIDNVGLSKEDMNDEDLLLAAEECIKAMKIESNPIAAFYISFGTIALSNYMALKAFMVSQAKEAQK